MKWRSVLKSCPNLAASRFIAYAMRSVRKFRSEVVGACAINSA